MATPTVQIGFLLAADITGYTGFLTQSELDHASEIMHELFKLLDRNLIRPIQIVKYEGDAVLCYARGDDISDPILILDLLEQVYVAFADGLFEMKRATTCSCQACRNMGVLDLKFFLHHGQFIIENHGRGDDLAGSDVILLHRLMKNIVLEKLGLQAYLLATETALTRLGSPTGFARHREAYEHFGEVECGVSDLGIALAEHRARREVRLTEDQALVRCSASIPVDVVTTWDYFLDPARRLLWDSSITGLTRLRNAEGREGIGASLHCAHGDSISVGTTLDWKPFRYFTQRYVSDSGPFPPMLMTWETLPISSEETQVTQLFMFDGDVSPELLGIREAIEQSGIEDLARLASVVARREAITGRENVAP